MKTDKSKIEALLRTEVPITIECTDVTASTNDDIRQKARLGTEEIYVLIADRQTAGKGSKGRSFFSPEGTGCYMSLLLRPSLRPAECTLLTTMAAAATAKAIERVCNKAVDIKWVNDIYSGGRKLAGILTEGAFINSDKIDYAVVGIGINLTEPEGGFPEELKNIAGALGNEEIKNELIAEIINEFTAYYIRLPDKDYMNEYRRRLFFLGREVRVIQGEKSFTATAKDIDDMCGLVVERADGTRITLNSGEISIRI